VAAAAAEAAVVAVSQHGVHQTALKLLVRGVECIHTGQAGRLAASLKLLKTVRDTCVKD
jgi:hypothetical protein